MESDEYFLWTCILSVTILIIKQATIGTRCTTLIDLKGKTVVVTGANSGIGYETAFECAQNGANVILGCRDQGRGLEAMKKIQKETRNPNVEFYQLDLSSFESIYEFVKNVKEAKKSIYALVNNAGIFWCPYTLTKNGIEANFGVNHLGHFLLTLLLLPLLDKQYGGSVVVMVSSLMHRYADTAFLSDINYKTKKYNSWAAYSNSKLCNIVFAKSLATFLRSKNIRVCSVDPGIIHTNIGRDSYFMSSLFYTHRRGFFKWLFFKDAKSGAQTTLNCIYTKDVELFPGGYFSECEHTYPWPVAYNKSFEYSLWKVSFELCGFKEANFSLLDLPNFFHC